jgi:hypothetical protein
MPPGWDAVIDHATGRLFYAHHASKTTAFDDPRLGQPSQQEEGVPHAAVPPSHPQQALARVPSGSIQLAALISVGALACLPVLVM